MKKGFILLSAFVILQSCGSSSTITGSYLNMAMEPRTYDRAFVMAITENTVARNEVENAFVARAVAAGMTAVRSIDVFPVSFKEKTVAGKEVLDGVIKKSGADIVVTMALVDEKHESRYVGGSTAYNPMAYGYYGGYYPYYSTRGAYMYNPGYYTEEKVYFFETNLYDVASEKLIWSAQSKTVNPTNLKSFAKEHTDALIYKMRKDGLVVHQKEEVKK